LTRASAEVTTQGVSWRLRVAGGFALGIVGISFAALFVRWALPAPPVVTAFWRMAISSALLAGWFGLRRGTLLPQGRARWYALLAGACFGTDLALWNTAIVMTSLANSTFLVNTTPIYVGIFSFWALGERPGGRFVWGALLALAGTAFLVGADWGGPEAVRGDALALAAALFYSGYLLLMKAVRRSHQTAPALLGVGVGATGVLLLYALVRGDPLTGFPASSWLAFVGAAVIAQLGGVMCVVWSLRYLRASFASLALLAQPAGTTLLGWLWMGESLSPTQALGAAAVGAGIALASGLAADPEAQENVRSSHQG
jgi:drug/metabolite transporter (DMT)-like permease